MALDAGIRTADDDESLAALLGRTARGDRAAFGELYDRVSPSVFGFLTTTVGEGQVSTDLLLDVFVDVWTAAPEVGGAATDVRAWVHGLAIDRAAHRLAMRCDR